MIRIERMESVSMSVSGGVPDCGAMISASASAYAWVKTHVRYLSEELGGELLAGFGRDLALRGKLGRDCLQRYTPIIRSHNVGVTMYVPRPAMSLNSSSFPAEKSISLSTTSSI